MSGPANQRRAKARATYSSCSSIRVATVSVEVDSSDWWFQLIQYLQDPNIKICSVHQAGIKDVTADPLMMCLYKRGGDGLLLRCIGKEEAMRVMAEVHEWSCGAHQAGIKIRSLIQRHGYYWPTILKDCIDYAKGCKPCQAHVLVHQFASLELHPIVKSRPFQG
ncbi:hypothetical protein CRG98_045562 [Punica granatum]|uniref:Integrase zinc-binding domain-containing protein n=1 Tax=Punica granatum TaxID=22663 RepID=A0A2I0HQR5_PUNGR|nr:hypothetical protein CRG98_045562 [Punica granatum]